MKWNKYPDSIPTGDTRKVLMIIDTGRSLRIELGWWKSTIQVFKYGFVEDANQDVVGWLDIPETPESYS